MIDYENLEKTNAPFALAFEAAFARVIKSGWYVLGAEVRAFESEFADYIGAKHCIGVANGLDAITLSLKALELPANSEVIVASNTYIATILAVLQAGLKPVLVEPNLATYNVDPYKIDYAVSANTRAICVTHMYGKPCDMEPIISLASERNLYLLEDCAQSHGAKVGTQTTGNFGIAGCFSFYPTKNLGAVGDAGAITTNDSDFADRLRHWRNYGSKQKYINVYPGVNSRLDEVQAAMLRVKLPYLDEITEHKRKLARQYRVRLKNSFVILPVEEPAAFDVFHIFAIRHIERDLLRKHLDALDIKTEIHYPIPPHRQAALKNVLQGTYPISEEIHNTILSLPMSFATTINEVDQVCNAIMSYKN